MACFQAKISWKRFRKSENKKKNLSDKSSYPTWNKEFQKNYKKIKNK